MTSTIDIVPLLLCDLDDTLVDRARVFAEWVDEFSQLHHLDDDGRRWLVNLDEFGRASREGFWTAIKARLHLCADVEALVADWSTSFADRYRCDQIVLDELARLNDFGWTLAIVTNGGADVQARKLAACGLDQVAHAVCISGAEGLSKPDRAIFALAAKRADHPLHGGCMIGDNPREDIEGAHHVGLRTIWLHRGRTWSLDSVTPDVTADNIVQALRHIQTWQVAGRTPDCQ